jgi:hypothetical protein
MFWIAQIAMNKSALADDFVKLTRLRNTGSLVFQLRLSGISAPWYLIWPANIFRAQCRPSDAFQRVKFLLRTMEIWVDLNEYVLQIFQPQKFRQIFR